MNFSSDHLDKYIFDVFPPIIQIVENHLVFNQRIGLDCINLLLKHENLSDPAKNCFQILKKNNYDELIYLKMKNLSYQPDISYLEILIENYFLFFSYNKLNRKDIDNINEVFEIDNKEDEIYCLTAERLYYEEKFPMIELYLKLFTKYMFPIVGCALIKHSKITIKCVNWLLDMISRSCPHNLAILIFEFIYEYFQIINANLFIEDLKAVHIKLFKIILSQTYEEKSKILNSEQNEIIGKIVDLLHLIESNSSNENKLFIKKFYLKLQESMINKQIAGLNSKLDLFIKNCIENPKI